MNIETIEKLSLQKGDLVLIKLSEEMSDAEVCRLSDTLRQITELTGAHFLAFVGVLDCTLLPRAEIETIAEQCRKALTER